MGWLLRVLAGLVVATLGYLLLFHAIESRRTAKGPWRVTFSIHDARPGLVVDQPALGISNVQIVFQGICLPTNLTHTIAFDQAQPVPFETPFGRCVFLDTTFLPGTVVIEAFGHQIQLLPRTLTINGREQPWQNGGRIELGAPPGGPDLGGETRRPTSGARASP